MPTPSVAGGRDTTASNLGPTPVVTRWPRRERSADKLWEFPREKRSTRSGLREGTRAGLKPVRAPPERTPDADTTARVVDTTEEQR